MFDEAWPWRHEQAGSVCGTSGGSEDEPDPDWGKDIFEGSNSGVEGAQVLRQVVEVPTCRLVVVESYESWKDYSAGSAWSNSVAVDGTR